MMLLEQGRPLRVIVIGAGQMGRRHALTLAALRNRGIAVALAGIADRHLKRAQAAAVEALTVGVDDYRVLLPAADAAIVAVPASDHFEVATSVLNAGLDVLVEKPICPELKQAADLCRLAERRRRVVQVGHLEWFNPAWQAATNFVMSPREINVVRAGPFAPGGGDVDVIRDLMIHDLHLLLTWIGQEPISISAIGQREQNGMINIAQVRLTFPDGCVATLLASRVSSVRKRLCRIEQTDSCLEVDFIEQSAKVYDGSMARLLPTDRCDLLEAQFAAFVSAIRSRCAGPVQGPALLSTMRTVHRIFEVIVLSMGQSSWAVDTPDSSDYRQSSTR